LKKLEGKKRERIERREFKRFLKNKSRELRLELKEWMT
jgi:hypothetical protein